MYDKGTRSWCMLENYVNDNYYARFHTAFTAAVTCVLVLDLTLILTKSGSVKCRSNAVGHGACLKSIRRTITMHGFILTAIIAAEKYTLVLDLT